MLGTFYGGSAESDLYGENTYRLLGNVSVGSVFDRKGKINGDVCRSACILLCAYRTAFLGQMLPFKAEKAVVDSGAVFVVLLAVGYIGSCQG